jgi:hypothetical protein
VTTFALFSRLRRARGAVAALIAAALVLPSAASVLASDRGLHWTVGRPWVGAMGISETVEEIQERAEEVGEETAEPENLEALKELLQPDREHLPQNPDSPAVSRTGSGSATEPPAEGDAPQTVGLNFKGARFADINAWPPDSMGAVGTTQYLVGVNERIRTFNKFTGVQDGVLNTGMDSFFASVNTSPLGTSDPRVRFDPFTQRWFVTIITINFPNDMLIAVSSGPVITSSTVFTFFRFDQDLVSPPGDPGCLADYPTLGIDNNALYIGANMFCAGITGFTGTNAYVVRKSSVLGAGPIVVTVFRGLIFPPNAGAGPFTPQGVDNRDPSATEGYFIGVDNASFGTLVLRRISDPGGTPAISGNINITVPTTSFPLDAPHSGGGANLDALDDRLMMAQMRNGHLWTTHNIAVTSAGVGATSGAGRRTGSRWYEISITPSTASLVQSGTLFDSAASNPKYLWMPSVNVSGQGHTAIGVSSSSANGFPNAATAGRLASDPAGATQAPIEYTASSFSYDPGDASDPHRWGDYSYTSVDPEDDMTMWTIQEWVDATNSYAVQVAQLKAPPPATPASASPATVAPGQPSVNVTITGTQVSGSGFFDPGPAFPKHVAGSVSGGVTVNSATYLNPTTVTLNISTVGATNGTKNVTVTNPDGQARTGSGILTVSSGGATPPSDPTGLTATGGNNQVSLSWTAPASDGGAAITNYKVYRGGSSGNETFLADTGSNATSYLDVTAVNGNTYFYQVAAENSAGVGPRSNEASASTNPSGPPTITGVSPGSGPTSGGTSVTVTGANFTGATSVTFGGAAATGVSVLNASTITATAPSHAAGTVDVAVTTALGTGTLVGGFVYTLAACPIVYTDAINDAPNTATGGNSQNVDQLDIVSGSYGNNTPSSFMARIQVKNLSKTVPSNGTAVSWRTHWTFGATNYWAGALVDGATGATSFQGGTYTVNPTTGATTYSGQTNVTPTGSFVLGPNGYIDITIPLANLGNPGTSATLTNTFGATFINLTVGGSGSLARIDRAPDQFNPPAYGSNFSRSDACAMGAPLVSGVTPASGTTRGGTNVTIAGNDFQSGAAVTFGGTAATGVVVNSANSITAVTPVHTAGPVDVRVTNPNSQAGTLTGGFLYVAPPRPAVCVAFPDSFADAPNNAIGGDGDNVDTLDLVNVTYGHTPGAADEDFSVSIQVRNLSTTLPSNAQFLQWTAEFTFTNTSGNAVNYFAGSVVPGAIPGTVADFLVGTVDSGGNYSATALTTGQLVPGPGGEIVIDVPVALLDQNTPSTPPGTGDALTNLSAHSFIGNGAAGSGGITTIDDTSGGSATFGVGTTCDLPVAEAPVPTTIAAVTAADTTAGIATTATASDVEDQWGNPIADGTVVTFDVDRPQGDTFTVAAGTTGGDATANLSGSQLERAGAYDVTAGVGSLSVSTTFNVSIGPLDHLVLSPATATITAGGSQAFTAEGFDSFDNSFGDVTGETIFTIEPNSSCTGNVCTANDAGPHTVTGNDQGATGTASLQVDTAPLDHIVLSPSSATITAGGSETYTAEAFDAFDNSLGDVTGTTLFSIAPNGSCAGDVCSATQAGAHTVTGTHSGKTDAASLQVDAGPLDHVVLDPSASSITAGGSQAYTAEAFDSFDNSLGDVTGSTAFSITPDGSCSANSCTATTVGVHTVSGTHAGKTGNATLQVLSGVLDHIVLSPASATITAGGSQAFTAEGFDSFDNSLGDVTPSTTFTIGPDGSCAGASCSATVAGAHTVTGTNGPASDTSSLQVDPGALDHIVVSPASATITAGGSETYTAEAFDAFDNSLGDVTGSTAFSISPNGTCTGNVCSATTAGAHTVTGTHSGKADAASLQVDAGPPATVSVALAPDAIVANGADTALATATVADGFGNPRIGDAVVLSTSGDAGIGPVADNGDGTYTATITASTTAGDETITATDGVLGTAILHEVAGTLDHLVLSPVSATITAGGSQAYTAEGRDAFDNSLGDFTGSTTFTIGPNGSCFGATCSATTSGAHTVTGTSGGKTGAASLQVDPAGLDHLVLSPASATITAGGSQAYTAQGRDVYDNVIGDVTASTAFTITPNGSCSGAGCSATVAGPHTVTGNKQGATGTASLQVDAGPLHHLVLSPPSVTVAPGGSQAYTADGRDAFENSLGDLTSATTFAIAPNGSCSANTCTATDPGVHTVTGTSSGKTGTASLIISSALAVATPGTVAQGQTVPVTVSNVPAAADQVTLTVTRPNATTFSVSPVSSSGSTRTFSLQPSDVSILGSYGVLAVAKQAGSTIATGTGTFSVVGNVMTMTIVPTTVSSRGTVTITATIRRSDTNAGVPGLPVTIVVRYGSITMAQGSLITDANGVVTLQAGGLATLLPGTYQVTSSSGVLFQQGTFMVTLP